MNIWQPPAPISDDIRSEFLIKPDLALLNHGSFGAVPKVVFDAHVGWLRRIEADPIHMIVREGPDLLQKSKESLGKFLGMSAADFGLVTNATEGINCVLRSLDFSPGDELVTTNHVYNAVRQAMKYVARRSGAVYREIDIPVPVSSSESIANQIVEALTPRTKLVVIDHITSPTALIFPIERIVAECNRRNIDTLIDGAHGPGMVPIDINGISPTYYAGNLHKWACAPKGCAFLWMRHDRQEKIHPLVISHHLDKGMPKEFGWQGTRDFAAWFTIPAAIEFLSGIGVEKIMAHNHALAVWVNQTLCERWKVESISPLEGSLLGSMATVRLPAPLDRISDAEGQVLQRRLHDEDGIEVPTMNFNGRTYLRPCCQIYNGADEYQRLGDAVARKLV